MQLGSTTYYVSCNLDFMLDHISTINYMELQICVIVVPEFLLEPKVIIKCADIFHCICDDTLHVLCKPYHDVIPQIPEVLFYFSEDFHKYKDVNN